MAKLVVTGSSGFVGSNLATTLAVDHEVTVILRNSSSLENIEHLREQVTFFYYDGHIQSLIDFFKEQKPDCVFHLASLFIAEHTSEQIGDLINSNILFGSQLLEAMSQSGVKNLINTGTSWQHYENNGYNPVCFYSATKEAFECLIEFYVQAHDFQVITLKLFDTYGENDKRKKLINLLSTFASEGTVLDMSPGNQELSLVHVEDVCSAFRVALKRFAIKRSPAHHRFAVRSSEVLSLKEVIALFNRLNNNPVNINWGGRPYRKREVMKTWSTGELLPDWSPKISLEDGLRRYITRG